MTSWEKKREEQKKKYSEQSVEQPKSSWEKKREEQTRKNTPVRDGASSRRVYEKRQETAAPKSTLEQALAYHKEIGEDVPIIDLGPQTYVDDGRTWFQKGALENGVTVGNVAKAAAGTAYDVRENLATAVLGTGEKTIDAVASQAPATVYSQTIGAYADPAQKAGMDIGQLIANLIFGKDLSYDPRQEMAEKLYAESKPQIEEFVAKDLYDEEKLAKTISRATSPLVGTGIIDPEKDSVLGEKSDALVQSAGQLATQLALNKLGVPWWLVSGVTSYGSEAESALQQGATLEEANASAAVTAAAEVLSEKISGGIKFGGKTLDDAITKQISKKISNRLVRALAKAGVQAAGEGFEEVLSDTASKFGQWLTYQDDKTVQEMFLTQEAFDQALEAFIGGSVLGGFGSVSQSVQEAQEAAKSGDKKPGTQVADSSVSLGMTEQATAEAKPGGLEWVRELNELGKQANGTQQAQSGEQTVRSVIDDLLSKNAEQAQKNADSEETTVTVKSAGSAIDEGNAQKNTLAYTLASNINAVSDMEPVSALTGREFNNRGTKLSDQIRDFFKSIGNKVFRNGLGDVEFGEYGIGGILNHRPINRAKAVSIAAVPDVIRNGRQIGYDPNWKGRGYESYTFAAPVTVNGTQVYVAAVVNKLPNNKFYLSEMVDSEGNYVRIEESPSGNSKNGLPMGLEDQQVRNYAGPEGLSEGDSPSATSTEPTPLFNNSISQTEPGVNSEVKNVGAEADALALAEELIALGQGKDAQKQAVDTETRVEYDNGEGAITDDEKAALLAYKSGGSYQLNAKLRDGIELDEQQQAVVNGLDSALHKLPVYKGTVYRNLLFDDFGGEDARSEFLESHAIGNVVVYDAYTSASTQVDGYPVEGNFAVHMVIESADSRNMAGYGNNFESEVLFARNTYIEINRIEHDTLGTPIIYATEVLYEGQSTETQTADGRGTEGTISGDHSGESRSSTEAQTGNMRQMQQARSGQTDVFGISERNPQGNSYGQADLRGVPAEVATQTTPTESVGAAPAGYAENTVGGAQSRFEHKQKTSAIYSNTYANTTDEDVRKVGEESKAADPNIDKYDVVTEKESLYNAEQRTRSEDEIDFEYEDLIHKSGWTGEDNDTAQRVLDHLRKSGDTGRFTELARKRREEGTRGAQLTQSFAKYTRMTATDCVLEAVEAIDNLTPNEVGTRHYKGKALKAVDKLASENVGAKHYKGKDFDAWKQELTTSVVNIANEIDAVEDGDAESLKDIIRSLAKFRKTTAWFGTSSKLTKIAEGALKDIDFDTAKAIANAQLSTLPNDFIKRPAGQIVKTIRIHNMLSALTTVNRNLAGNASIGIVDAISDSTVGRALDALVSLATNKRTVGNEVAHGRTYFEGAAKAAKLAALCTELDIPMDSESRFTTGHTRTYSPQGGPVTRFLSAYEKCMRYALEVSDQFFDGGTNAVVEKSLDALSNKANLTTDEASQIAELVGKRRTFKDDRMVARAAKGVKEGLNELGTGNIGVGDFVLPFAGTGSNVGQTAVDYSSLGIGGLIDMFRLMHDVKTGKYENGVKKITKNGRVIRKVSLVEAQRQAVTNAARGLTGAGLIAGFAALAAAGILGVHDDEDKDKRGLEQAMNLSGAQLNVDAAMRWVRGESADWQDGDWCLSVDFLEPFNAQMYVGYLLSQEDSIQDIAKSYPQNAVAGVYQSIMDMPMMQGLSDFSDMVTNVGSTLSEGGDWKDTMAEAGGQLLGNTASGFIPSYVRQTAQVIDPYYRDTSSDTAGGKAVNQIFSMIPGLSTTLPKKYSGLGQEQRRYEDLASGVFNTFVNPGELEQIKSSDVADYLDELSERTGDVTFYPAYIAPGSFKMDGEKVTINGKQNTEDYQKTYGTNVNRLYGQLIKNADFLDASDELQAKILNSAKDYAVMLAKAKVSDYAEVPSYIKNRASGMSEAEAILRHALLTKANGDAASKNTEKYSYLSVDDASWVVDMISRITPEKSDGEVRTIQKIEAVAKADSNLTENEQQKVMKDILTDSMYEKYLDVLKLKDNTGGNLNNDDFAASYRIYLDENEKGGKGTKDRTVKAMQKALGVSQAVAKKLYDIYG